MNDFIRMVIAGGFMIIICHSSKCQKFMYLEESFKKSSQTMSAKRKGFSSLGKYEFGPYKIISGKQGWTLTESKTNFWSGDSKSESLTKSSFVFTGLASDTITANVTHTSVLEIDEQNSFVVRTLTNWYDLETTQSEVFIADFSSAKDTTKWSLVLAYPVEDEIITEITAEMISRFKGKIVSSNMSIDIVPEFRWENGKSASMFKPLEAYTFQLDGVTIAAVQAFPFHKLFVWIKNDLTDEMKNVLAVSSATMMVRSEQSL